MSRHRALIGYLLLIVVVLVSLELYHQREEGRIERVQQLSCENTSLVIANQKLVLRSLISLRIAALASPYLRIEAERELVGLQKALSAVEDREDPCELFSE